MLLEASLISLLLHAGVVAAALAVESWLLSAVDSARFGGRQVVVQMQAAPAPQPRSGVRETLVLEITPSESPESHALEVVALAPEPMTPTRRPSEVSPSGELRPHAPPSESVRSSPRQSPARMAQPREAPTVADAARPLPRQVVAVQPPSPAVKATPPVAPGTNDDVAPSFAGNRPPAYPAEAYRRGIEGRVLLRLLIAESGDVERVEVIRSSGFAILDAAAVEAVRTWRGTPARRGGVAVPTVEELPVVFRLRD